MKKIPSVVLSFAILNFSLVPAFAQRVVLVPKGGLAPIQGRVNAPTAKLSGGSIRTQIGVPVKTQGLVPSVVPAVTVLPGETVTGLDAEIQTQAVEVAQPGFSGESIESLTPVAPLAVAEDKTPAAASQDSEEAPQAARPGVLARLARAVTSRLSGGKLFDFSRPGVAGLGILPQKPIVFPYGLEMDQPPSAPTSVQDSGVNINSFGFPVERPSGAVMDEAPATVLDANAADDADVERALRAYIDENRSKYGVSSSDLKTIHVKRVNNEGKVPGVSQAETLYAYFHQQRNGLAVHSSFASFTIKVLQGKPVLLAAQARLYPAIAAQTVPQYSDEDLLVRAQRRLEEFGVPQQIVSILEYFQQKIIYTGGAWRTASIYVLPGFPVMVAVDVVTGDAFIWDSRVGAEDARSLAGKLSGRGESSDSRPAGQAEISQQPLAHVSVTLEGGMKAVTDRNGRFTSSSSGGEVKFTATLSGKYATVNDQSGKPLKVSASLKPGAETEVVYNPEGSSEIEVSQVNAYVATTRVHDYLKDHGIDDARIDKAIPVNVNIDDECNAYYTPGRPSLNFFKSSVNCSDTARPGIVAHEYGHFVDDMIGGIVNGGLSEGWGDIFSMFMLKSPIVGDGFLKNRTPSYIRHGENDYQYQQYDEVHDQGQAWMGFGWKLHKALTAAMGASGAALAETLVLPTLFAKAADIPTAIAQVLLNDMDANGNMPHEEYIRAAAKAHGIEIPKSRIASLSQAAQMAAGMLTADRGMNFAAPAAPVRFIVTYRGSRPLQKKEYAAMRRSLEKGGVSVLDQWNNTFLVEGYPPAVRAAVSGKKKGWSVSPEKIYSTQAERWTPAGQGIYYSRAIPVEQRAILVGALHSNQAQWSTLMEAGGFDNLKTSLMVKSAVVETSGWPNVVKKIKYSAEVIDGRQARQVVIRVEMGGIRSVEFTFKDGRDV